MQDKTNTTYKNHGVADPEYCADQAVLRTPDIKGFFDHTKLLNMLMQRIDDKPLLKLIRRWLKAGIASSAQPVLALLRLLPSNTLRGSAGRLHCLRDY